MTRFTNADSPRRELPRFGGRVGREHTLSRRKERLSSWLGRAAPSGEAHVALSGVLGDDLLVERGDLGGDRLPAKAFPGVGRGWPAASAPLVCVGGGVAERCHERLLVVGCH